MRIKSFDCLRGYGALVILFAHLPRLGDSDFAYYFHSSFYQFSIGYIWLDVFFVMSGYLITSIILKEKGKGVFSFGRFYLNRALRIFPIYYLTIILVALFITSDNIWYSVFYLSNYYFATHIYVHPLNHSWSLSVEEHFYLLWPLLLTAFDNKRCKFILSVIVPFITLSSVIIIPLFLPHDKAYQLIILGTTTRWFSISLGSYLAFHKKWLEHLSRKKFRVIVFCSLLLYLVYYLMPIIPVLTKVPGYIREVCIVPFISFALLVIWFRMEYMKESWLKKMMINDAGVYLGKISYGVYLYHYPILYYFGMLDWQKDQTDNTILYWSLIGFVIVLASFSYHFIESPILKLKANTRVGSRARVLLSKSVT